MLAPGNQAGIAQQVVLRDAVIVSPQALARIALHILAAARNKGNALMSMRYEVAQRFQNAFAVIRHNARPRFARSDEDQGMPLLA